MKYLFIGGEADGQWLLTDGGTTWNVAKRVPLTLVPQREIYILRTDIDIETYEMFQLHGEVMVFTMYKQVGMPVDTALATLVNGYVGKLVK